MLHDFDPGAAQISRTTEFSIGSKISAHKLQEPSWIINLPSLNSFVSIIDSGFLTIKLSFKKGCSSNTNP